MKKDNLNTCKNCTHWKKEQAELDYSKHHGICTCFKWKFSSTNYADCMVLDRADITQKFMGVNRFESQSNVVPFGVAEKSNYCFVTEEEFGCINYAAK